MELESLLPTLLGAAWLVPLASFTLIVFFGPRMGKGGVLASYVATGAILTSFVLSAGALISYCAGAPAAEEASHDHVASPSDAKAHDDHAHAADSKGGHDDHHAVERRKAYTNDWYLLGQFGKLRVTVSYYIDGLTVGMFAMITLIASCIHFYAIGYMHDELHEITDHEVIISTPTAHGHGHDEHHATSHAHEAHAHDTHGHEHDAHDAHGHDSHALPAGKQYLTRPGRFHRFFQYLSLFCFSMLGLVVAGNIAMVFVFWELVGICSYFLIGFYIERKSASNAANKAFIVNRVGDFGMIIGLMALWGALGTFAFGDVEGQGPGLFSQVRPAANEHQLTTPDGMVLAGAQNEIAAGVKPTAEQIVAWREQGVGYWLLVVAGLGIFCGCVGKSAQFPLHVWLPDAMEGPTPVSALVHSATMVAAGVYLVGRFYPVFPAEALLTIAYIGAITLFIAATIAITATDIKRVLAYSTVSQLGFMMLALGVGGWAAGMFHLITHAFFKSLLFMCSGSVIHACHTNEMPKMGGLRHKMPFTAYTMLVGCLAIAGTPFFSGFYSKDAIIAQAMSFAQANPSHSILLYAVSAGAAITAFYMFRLWYLTFAGEPRDAHIFDHAHESPPVMYRPLILLATFAFCVGWPMFGLAGGLLEGARPAGAQAVAVLLPGLVYPDEHLSHDFHTAATLVASAVAGAGFLLATVFYCWKLLSAADARQQFAPIYKFLLNKWYFDELYDWLFVRPTFFIAGLIANFDKQVIDRFIESLAAGAKRIATCDDLIDRYFIDGIVNLTAHWTFAIGRSLRAVQTGRLRQYVMFIVVGAVALTMLIQWSVASSH